VRAAIAGLGQWLPERVRENSEWPANFVSHAAISTERELADAPTIGVGRFDAIMARHLAPEEGDPFLGSSRRRVADDTMTSSEAEARAAGEACRDAGIVPEDIDVVLSWTLVPDRPSPPSAPRVAHLVGARRAVGFGMDAACATIVGQLLFAATLVESGRARYVLITGSHLAARAFHMVHPASPCIGDGATAVVVGPSEQPGILSVFAASEGEYHDAVVWRRSGRDTPWYLAGGDYHMGSHDPRAARRLVHDTVRTGVETVTEAAARANVAVDSIDLLACVQPRRWMPAAIAEGLGLPSRVAVQTYDELAHLGACGVVTNLIEGRRLGLLGKKPDGKPATACIYAQGAGFTRGAAIVRWVA
jgi:3-oxoacyl-[acyl-carrier-protein] synthase-3